MMQLILSDTSCAKRRRPGSRTDDCFNNCVAFINLVREQRLSLPTPNHITQRTWKQQVVCHSVTCHQHAFRQRLRWKMKCGPPEGQAVPVNEFSLLSHWREDNGWISSDSVGSPSTWAVEMKQGQASFFYSRHLLTWLVPLIVLAALPSEGHSFDNRKQMCSLCFWLNFCNHQL